MRKFHWLPMHDLSADSIFLMMTCSKCGGWRSADSDQIDLRYKITPWMDRVTVIVFLKSNSCTVRNLQMIPGYVVLNFILHKTLLQVTRDLRHNQLKGKQAGWEVEMMSLWNPYKKEILTRKIHGLFMTLNLDHSRMLYWGGMAHSGTTTNQSIA